MRPARPDGSWSSRTIPEAASFVIQVLGVRGNFDVTHTADPVAALLRASTEPWDLVLTDVEMPGMTGIELLESLRQVAPDLPVAIMTAHASVGQRGRRAAQPGR